MDESHPFYKQIKLIKAAGYQEYCELELTNLLEINNGDVDKVL